MGHSEYLFVTVFGFCSCLQFSLPASRYALLLGATPVSWSQPVCHIPGLSNQEWYIWMTFVLFLRFRGLKIAKIGHNWRVSKIGTKPYAGYTAVSYLERIHCYREKSPLLAPSGIGSMGTFTTQDILTFLYWLQNRLGFCWTYALAAKVSFPCIRFCWTYAVELPEWIDKGFVGLTTELAAGVNIALFHTKMKEKLKSLL